MLSEIITEHHEDNANLLHMPQFVEWGVVTDRNKPDVFLNQWNSGKCDRVLHAVYLGLGYESQHGEQMLHDILLDLSVADPREGGCLDSVFLDLLLVQVLA